MIKIIVEHSDFGRFVEECSYCDGNGHRLKRDIRFDMYSHEDICPRCDGSGEQVLVRKLYGR